MLKVEHRAVPIAEVFNGYEDRDDEGVVGYGGKLDIRPPYQRNFVYTKPGQKEEVVRTALKGFPLGIMYWVKTGDDTYEVLDGQQRTLSLMTFLKHKFQVDWKNKTVYEDGLTSDEYEDLLKYPFDVYICEGTDSEKLEWFEIVNIGGEELTRQELLNITYTGPWLSDAKLHFSKRNCVAISMGKHYVKGDPNRQELLELALKWISDAHGCTIKEYMAAHKSSPDADELWQYYQDVINWIEKLFGMKAGEKYTKMRGLDWGIFYNKYHNNQYNSAFLQSEVARLMTDDEVDNKAGIFEFLLRRDTDPYAGRLLNLRQFDKRDALKKYQEQGGKCADCGRSFKFEEMHADHKKPWSKGGLTEYDNLQMLCKDCNLSKSDKY